MERTEEAAGAAVMARSMSASSSEFAPKNLARQLDFTPILGVPVRHLPAQQQAVTPAVQPVIQRFVHPVSRPAFPTVLTVPESPRPQPQPAVLEVKDSTPKKQKHCNCKNSRCLKLYCECFASGNYCDGCNCLNCHNNVDHEATRLEAIGATLERNPNAFRPKVANSPHGSRVGKQEVGPAQQVVKHNKGCNCKKSGCLKKYCECFQANVLCSDNCKCLDCKNFEGSDERHAVVHGNSYNTMLYQATNAAINGAIGSSPYVNSPLSRKRRNQDNIMDMYNNQRIYHNGQYAQGNQLKCTTSSFPAVPSSHGTNAHLVSKVTYRSPLAGAVQPQDVKELCSLLVLVSKEAANTLTDLNTHTKGGMDPVESSNHMMLDVKVNDQESVHEQGVPLKDPITESSTRMCADGSGLDESDKLNGRPASPGTMALMCYEQHTELMEGGSPTRQTADSQKLPCQTSLELELPESYVEQERLVLTKFRDYLNRLITHGSIKETMCSSLAKSEAGTEGQPLRSDVSKDGHLGNALAKPHVPIANHTSARTNGVAFGLNNAFALSIGLPVESDMLRSKIEETVGQC